MQGYVTREGDRYHAVTCASSDHSSRSAPSSTRPVASRRTVRPNSKLDPTSDHGSVIDFLATRDMATAWFTHAPAGAGCVLSRTARRHDQGRSTRATRRKSTPCAPTSRPTPARIPQHRSPSSTVPPPTRPQTSNCSSSTAIHRRAMVHRDAPDRVLLARLASEAISFFAGPDRTLLRRRATPTCELLFVARHHRRRFYSEPCSQRTRQHRYYRSHHSTPTHDAGANA